MNARLRRRLRRAAAWAGIGAVAVVLLCNRWVINSTDAYVYRDAGMLPENEVALVLGCSPFVTGGDASPQFIGRMKAAAELFQEGKVKRLILSGANPDARYNEPKKMREALLQLGVPDDAMTLDLGGMRTLDSVARTRSVAGMTRFTIVTQKYHAYRALFLARKMGLQAVAYAASTGGKSGFRHPPREVLARVLAVLDLGVMRLWPGWLGDVPPPAEAPR